jgi:hypothetical protein
MAVATPPLLTVATEVLLEAQAAILVRLTPVPLAKVGEAMSWACDLALVV